MEAIALKLPDTLEGDELLRILNGEIILSQATRFHESFVIIPGVLIANYFFDKEGYDVLGSNVKIVIPDQEGDVNADLSVVKDPVEYGLTLGGKLTTMRIKNPEIVVEVLLKSTRKFDLTEKITCHKLIPSLQYILFVDQYRPFASVYARTKVPDEWLNHDYRTLESVVRLGDLELPMEAIYRKMIFDN